MRVIVCVSCVLCDGVCFCSSCRGAVPTALLAGPIVSVHDSHAGHEADSGTTGRFQLLEGGTLATAYIRFGLLYGPIICCNLPLSLSTMTLLQHQVDKLILPRDEHLRIAIVIFIVPFIVNVSTPTPT